MLLCSGLEEDTACGTFIEMNLFLDLSKYPIEEGS